MGDIARTSTPEPLTANAGRWIGRVIIAVILAEGIWGLIVSLTNNLVLPLMATAMGTDARSPLYLGKADINVPALFASVLELCFAGIAFVIMSAWINRRPKASRRKPVRVTLIPVQPVAPPPPSRAVEPLQGASPAPLAAAVGVPSATAPQPVASQPPAESSPAKVVAPPPPPKPAKPKPPREIVYNSVGEPLPFDDDE